MARTIPPRRKATRSYDPEQSRRALIDAAVACFGTEGFHTTSVQQVVDAAGLTKGAFYHHFESKEDLLHVIHDAFIDEHLRRQERILERFDRAHERLFHLVRTLVVIVAAHRPEVQIFFQEQRALSPTRYRASFDKRETARQIYVDTMALGVGNGEFRADIDPELGALGILGMGNWTYQWYRPDGRLAAHDISRALAAQALFGVTARPRAVRALLAKPIPEPDPARA